MSRNRRDGRSLGSQKLASQLTKSRRAEQERRSVFEKKFSEEVLEEMKVAQETMEEGLRRRAGSDEESRRLAMLLLILVASSAVINVAAAVKTQKTSRNKGVSAKTDPKKTSQLTTSQLAPSQLAERIEQFYSPDITQGERNLVEKAIRASNPQEREIIGACLDLVKAKGDKHRSSFISVDRSKAQEPYLAMFGIDPSFHIMRESRLVLREEIFKSHPDLLLKSLVHEFFHCLDLLSQEVYFEEGKVDPSVPREYVLTKFSENFGHQIKKFSGLASELIKTTGSIIENFTENPSGSKEQRVFVMRAGIAFLRDSPRKHDNWSELDVLRFIVDSIENGNLKIDDFQKALSSFEAEKDSKKPSQIISGNDRQSAFCAGLYQIGIIALMTVKNTLEIVSSYDPKSNPVVSLSEAIAHTISIQGLLETVSPPLAEFLKENLGRAIGSAQKILKTPSHERMTTYISKSGEASLVRIKEIIGVEQSELDNLMKSVDELHGDLERLQGEVPNTAGVENPEADKLEAEKEKGRHNEL